MKRPRIKICGITNIADAEKAIVLGADALGFVFYEPSPRYINIDKAAEIVKRLPPFVTIVGLFVDAESNYVKQALSKVALDILQFHGNESAEYCDQMAFPYIKALRMSDDLDVDKEIAKYPQSKAVLLDAYKKGIPGGTGEVFDWARVPKNSPKPIILAGGLTRGNIGEAVSKTLPYAVDVSGGVESAPGIKDHKKIEDFISAV